MSRNGKFMGGFAMKFVFFVLFLLLFPIRAEALEKKEGPGVDRVTPEQIEEILDFESIDRELEEKEERFRRHLRNQDPRVDEEEKRVTVAFGSKGAWTVRGIGRCDS